MGGGGNSGQQAAKNLGQQLSGDLLSTYNASKNGNSYAGLGINSQAGLKSITNAATSNAGALTDALNANSGVIRSGGYNDALTSAQAGIKDYLGQIGMEAPGYQTLRNKLSNDVTTNNLAAFNNSGLFGSDNNRSSLAEGLGNALGQLDYQQYNNSLDRMLGGNQALANIGQTAMGNAAAATASAPALYSSTLLPGQTVAGVGQIQDAAQQAKMDANYNNIARTLQLLTGGAGVENASGNKAETPWWQQALGGAISLGGAFL